MPQITTSENRKKVKDFRREGKVKSQIVYLNFGCGVFFVFG